MSMKAGKLAFQGIPAFGFRLSNRPLPPLYPVDLSSVIG